MARNQEKAQSMLYRFREAQRAEMGIQTKDEKRPYLASLVDNIKDCERWRFQIIKEVSNLVSKIQDPALGDYQIRDLNDQINKLLREKHHWERRILDLGGPNYKAQSIKVLDDDGKEVPGGQRGYRYFGRALELPGVKELFQTDAPESKEKTRAELGKYIDADYYGYRDEDDEVLLEYEAQIEEAAHGPNRHKPSLESSTSLEPASVARAKKRKTGASSSAPADSSTPMILDPEDENDESHQLYHAFVSHVPNIPTQEEVEAFLLKRRKDALLAKYLGPAEVR